MSLETLNDFATVLEMPLSELVIDPDEINSDEPLRLRRVQSPRLIIEDLAKNLSTDHSVCCGLANRQANHNVLANVLFDVRTLTAMLDWAPESLDFRRFLRVERNRGAHVGNPLSPTGAPICAAASSGNRR